MRLLPTLKLRRRFVPASLAAIVLPFLAVEAALCATPADADHAFRALNAAYWDAGDQHFRKEERGTTPADFWLEAQLWDLVMDQYDRTGDPLVRRQIDAVYDGFIKRHPDWTVNKYNDDIIWWAIACARACKITSDVRYSARARAAFDFVYDHFQDDALGGGIYWTSERTSKNSCVNAPAVIAAVRISKLLDDPSYFQKAESLYAWQKKTLTDGAGKVFDSVRKDRRGPAPRVARFSLTYNQGTFIGAAVLLYQRTGDGRYLEDAVRAAEWTRDNLCVGPDRILKSEGQGDGGAFKGIFVRYMKLLVFECGRSEFLPWMRANADAAWRSRRPADDLMGADWTTSAGPGIQSQTAASAVAVLLNFADEHPRNPAGRASGSSNP